MNTTVRTTDRRSPATDVAIISIDSGLSCNDIGNSMAKRPWTSDVTRAPLTLTVASGEVNPATVIESEVTTASPAGDVTSSSNSAISGRGAGPGVDGGGGAGTDVAVAGGGVERGRAAGVDTRAVAGAGVLAGAGTAVGKKVDAGETVATEAGAASSPPHAVNRPIKTANAKAATRVHLRRKIVTAISFLR